MYINLYLVALLTDIPQSVLLPVTLVRRFQLYTCPQSQKCKIEKCFIGQSNVLW